MARSRRYPHHDIPPVRAGPLHRRSFESRAAPDPRVGEKRPRLMGGSGAARGCTPGVTSDRLAALEGRHPGLRARRGHRLMSVRGTQLKLTGHHGYGCLPPHCRRAALNVGSSAEDRPDSELLRMRTSDPIATFKCNHSKDGFRPRAAIYRRRIRWTMLRYASGGSA